MNVNSKYIELNEISKKSGEPSECPDYQGGKCVGCEDTFSCLDFGSKDYIRYEDLFE